MLDGSLALLVINKHPTAALNVSINVDGFKVGQSADVFTYGIPQDEAAHTGIGSADVAQTTATLTGQTFTFSPAPYSATVIKISKPHDDKDEHDEDGNDEKRDDKKDDKKD